MFITVTYCSVNIPSWNVQYMNIDKTSTKRMLCILNRSLKLVTSTSYALKKKLLTRT